MNEYLIVVKPKRPETTPRDFHGVSMSGDPIKTYVVGALDKADALRQVNCPPGATLYVADMIDVATYEVPEKPKPVRVDL